MIKAKLATDSTLLFECPGCRSFHGIATDPARPFPQGQVWEWNGSEESPTLSPSILCTSRRRHPDGSWRDHVCHSFVRDGRIEYLSDCTHELAGQTVDLPDWTD